MNNKSKEPFQPNSVPAEIYPIDVHLKAGKVLKSEQDAPSDTDKNQPSTTRGQGLDNAEGKTELLDNRFELLDMLGTGNISTVYKSIDWIKSAKNRDHYVTIKVLKRRFQASRDWDAFEEVLTKYHSLDHPNIARVNGLSQIGATGFLIMEHLSGESLGQKIRFWRERQMPVNQMLDIVNKIGQALSYAHEQGLVHGDLKPANVFLTDSGEVKVMDFGLALSLRSTAKDNADLPQIGANNYSASTASYASLELLDHRNPSAGDDVYALACMTYEMLAGQHPYNRVRATGAQEFGLKLAPSDAFTDAQWNSLQKALAFDRDNRTSTIAEFLSDLEATESHRVRWISLVAGIFVSLVVISFLFVQQDSTSEEETADSRIPISEQDVWIEESSLSIRNERDSLTDIAPEPAIQSVQSQTNEKLSLSDEQMPTLPLVKNDSSPLTAQAEKPVSADDRLAVISQEVRQANTDTGIAGPEESDSPDTPNQGQRKGIINTIPGQQNQQPVVPLNRQVADLMDLAESQIIARRLTLPAGENAVETYRQILSLIPEHEGAKQGIMGIKKQYIKLSEAARDQGDWQKAKGFMQRSASIEPWDNAALLAMLRKLEASIQARQQQASQQAAKDAQEPARVTQTPITKPAVEIAQIDGVKHKLITTDQDSPLANFQARISGAVTQVQVFIDTGNGFLPHKLYDDGSHGDRTSGDGEFHASVPLVNQQSDTRYYVTAFTDKGASVSSPVGAKNETYLIKPLPGTSGPAVVINEFMASNDQTIADSMGGYDDWIELYNRRQQMIDLAGFYLSDNPEKPKKWKFPNGSRIVAGGYLIVWADRSSSSTDMTSSPPELHTNFTLSRSSGKILLVGPDDKNNPIIDQISFGRQREDRSIGRFPNGLGEFGSAQVTPTPGRSNSRQ